MNFDPLGGGAMTDPIRVQDEWETIVPVRDQVLIRPDPPKKQTKSGIVLPDSVRVPVFRGRVIAISNILEMQYEAAQVPNEHRIRELDRVIFHWNGAMPQELEKDHCNILVSICNIFAKIKTDKKHDSGRTELVSQP